jgi:excisionase family DNA binding protein
MPKKNVNAPPNMKPLVTNVRGAQVALDCGHDQVYDLMHSGEIESYLDGRKRCIVVASIEAYVARRRAASKEFERARYPVPKQQPELETT